MKNIFKKFVNACKAGEFWLRLKIVWRNKRYRSKHIYSIKNPAIKCLQEEDKWLRKFAKKYAKVIETGVEVEEKPFCNKVWMLWLTGLESAPPIVKACYQSVKNNMPDREVIFLSEDTVGDYIQLPKHIVEKRQKKMIGAAHYADLIRMELLCKYGGMWIDSTVLCTATATDFQPIINAPLFLYHDVFDVYPRKASNWLIVNNGNSKILALTKKLMFQFWDDYDYAVNYLFLDLLMALAAKRYPEEWAAMPPYNNYTPRVMQTEMLNSYDEQRWKEFLQMSSFHKLTYKARGEVLPDSFFQRVIDSYLY